MRRSVLFAQSVQSRVENVIDLVSFRSNRFRVKQRGVARWSKNLNTPFLFRIRTRMESESFPVLEHRMSTGNVQALCSHSLTSKQFPS